MEFSLRVDERWSRRFPAAPPRPGGGTWPPGAAAGSAQERALRSAGRRGSHCVPARHRPGPRPPTAIGENLKAVQSVFIIRGEDSIWFIKVRDAPSFPADPEKAFSPSASEVGWLRSWGGESGHTRVCWSWPTLYRISLKKTCLALSLSLLYPFKIKVTK